MKNFYVILILMLVSNIALADMTKTKILRYWIYGNGDLGFATIEVVNEPACPGLKRVDLPASHPQMKNYIAILSLAITTDKYIQMGTQGCFSGSPTIPAIRGPYLMIEKN